MTINKKNFTICTILVLRNNTNYNYRKISDISRTLVGKKILNHSDVVGAAPVGAAPSTSIST